MQRLKINILQASVVTLFRCGDVCNNLFIADFLLSVTVKEFLKNVPTLLKYPPEYTAYFFEPPRRYDVNCTKSSREVSQLSNAASARTDGRTDRQPVAILTLLALASQGVFYTPSASGGL